MRNILLIFAAGASLAAFGGTPSMQHKVKRLEGIAPKTSNVINPEMRKTRVAAAEREGYVLYEDFEGWDGQNAAWLPAGWTIDHKDSPASDRGWRMTEPLSIYDLISSKCMTYNMFEEEVDEWLITPEIRVAEGMELRWSTMTSPYFYNWDYFDNSTFQITEYEIINDINVNVSTDGGTTWKQIFSHAENLIEETGGNFFAMFDYTVRPFTLSLSEFAGKDIKIGFRISGFDGNTTFLDNVTVGLPPTQTSYRRPLTNLFFGLTDTDSFVPASLMIGPVFRPVTYSNTTKTTGAEFLWTYDDSNGEGLTSTEKNLTVTYETDYTDDFTTRNNLYPFPTLRGSSDATSADEFTYPGYYQAGGRAEYEIHYVDTDEREVLQLGMTVADPFTEGATTWADIALPYFGYNNESDRFWSQECFGSDYQEGGKNWKHLEKIGDFFYTPDSPIVIEGIRMNAFGRISRNARFTAEIYLLDAGYRIPATPAYTAVCTGNDITIIDRNSANNFIGLNFKFDKPLVLDKKTAPYFMVAIGGFRDADNVEYFSPEMSEKSNPNNLGLAWIGSQICWEGDMLPFSWSAVANYTMDELVSFYIMLDGIFPWLEGENESVTIAPGYPASLELNSYYDGSELTFEGLPSWLTAKASGRYGKTSVTFTAADTDTSYDEADVTIKAPGVSKTVKVTLDTAGIDSITGDFSGEGELYTISGIKADRNNAAPGLYIIRYPDGRSRKVIL